MDSGRDWEVTLHALTARLHGEVRDTVEPMLHVADLLFVTEAAIQTGNAEIIARCKEQLAHGINEFFGWEGKA